MNAAIFSRYLDILLSYQFIRWGELFLIPITIRRIGHMGWLEMLCFLDKLKIQNSTKVLSLLEVLVTK